MSSHESSKTNNSLFEKQFRLSIVEHIPVSMPSTIYHQTGKASLK